MANNIVAVGTIGTARVGRHFIEVEVVKSKEDKLTVRSLATQREFTVRALVTRHEDAPAEESPASEATPRVRKRSLIEAAAKILKESAEPMNTRSMVQAAIERGLWTPTNCKTPEQSLYGAIFREIKVSATPRFRKSATQGAFEYVSNG